MAENFRPNHQDTNADNGNYDKDPRTVAAVRSILEANRLASTPTPVENVSVEPPLEVVDNEDEEVEVTTPDQAKLHFIDLRRALGPTRKLDH